MYQKLKEKLEKAEWSNEDIWELVLEFDGLCVHWARKYAWGGIEFDDLHQIGRLATFYLIKQCRHRELLAAYVARSLPGHIQNAAKAMRWRKETVWLDEETKGAEEVLCLFDLDAERAFDDCDFEAMLRVLLPEESLRLADARLSGYTERDIAAAFGISQPAVAKRMKKLREMLRLYFKATAKSE